MYFKRGEKILNVKTRRWLYFVAIFTLTLFLCWQRPSDSAAVTGGVCSLIRNILAGIGIDIECAGLFYFIIRKTGHFLMFMVLAVYGYFAFSATTADRLKSASLAALICAATAVFTECTQQFFNGRETTLFDAGVNLFGVLVGLAVAVLIQAVKSKIKHRKPKTA